MVSPSSRSTLFPYTTLFRSRSFARIGLQIHGMAEGVMHEHLLQTAHDPPQHRHFVLFDPLLRPQRLGVAVHVVAQEGKLGTLSQLPPMLLPKQIGRASCREGAGGD